MNRLTIPGLCLLILLPFLACQAEGDADTTLATTEADSSAPAAMAGMPAEATNAASPAAQPGREIYINGQRMDLATIQAFERQYGVTVQNGAYWYDPISGLWGMWGGPTVGQLPAGLNLGGTPPANASGSQTNVFINGRAIHPQELATLQQLGPVYAGRYWLDYYGNYGYEGGGMIGNLVQIAQAQANYGGYGNGGSSGGGNGGGNTFFRNGYTGIGGGSSGGTSYVIGEDFSVIVD